MDFSHENQDSYIGPKISIQDESAQKYFVNVPTPLPGGESMKVNLSEGTMKYDQYKWCIEFPKEEEMMFDNLRQVFVHIITEDLEYYDVSTDANG